MPLPTAAVYGNDWEKVVVVEVSVPTNDPMNNLPCAPAQIGFSKNSKRYVSPIVPVIVQTTFVLPATAEVIACEICPSFPVNVLTTRLMPFPELA